MAEIDMDIRRKVVDLDARIAARKAAVDGRFPAPVAAAAKSGAVPAQRPGAGETILKVLVAVFAIAFILNLGWAIDRCLIHPPEPPLPDGIEALPDKIDPRVKEIPIVGSIVNGIANAASLAADAVNEDVPAPDPPWWLFAPAAAEAALALLLFAILRAHRKTPTP